LLSGETSFLFFKLAPKFSGFLLDGTISYPSRWFLSYSKLRSPDDFKSRVVHLLYRWWFTDIFWWRETRVKTICL